MYLYSSFFTHWHERKQQSLSNDLSVIPITSLESLSSNELSSIASSLSDFNYAVYDVEDSNVEFESVVTKFSQQLGLYTLDKHHCVEEDRITKIFDNSDQQHSFYIPYTNKPINWHTDGYYNEQDKKVYSFILHCQNPAFEGGVNSLLDQDQVFIHLMSINPLYIDALMKPDVMTIPENRKEGVLIRPQTSTAIFDVLNEQHDVLMRYSMRKKNIIFKDDTLTKEALSCMDEFINSNSSPHVSIKLKAGQGVICNNILHKRTAFKDKIGSERLYYRARFYNRITIK